jgi:hypothetical protein
METQMFSMPELELLVLEAAQAEDLTLQAPAEVAELAEWEQAEAEAALV